MGRNNRVKIAKARIVGLKSWAIKYLLEAMGVVIIRLVAVNGRLPSEISDFSEFSFCTTFVGQISISLLLRLR